jgi:anti-sigma B factor antagonist
MRRECEIEVRKLDNLVTIEIKGDLTASAEEDMKNAYKEAWDYDPGSIVLKFNSENRINSAGMAILISLLTQSQKRGCRVFIIGLSEHFREIFDLIGLTEYSTIVESEEDIKT